MGEGGGEEDEEECVYFGESVRFHAGAFDHRNRSSCEEIGGAVPGEEEGPAYDVHRFRKSLQ